MAHNPFPTIQFEPVAWRVSCEGGWTVYGDEASAQLDFESHVPSTLEPLFSASYLDEPQTQTKAEGVEG